MDAAVFTVAVSSTVTIFILTVTYHVGRQSMRIDKLEEWRQELRVELESWRKEWRDDILSLKGLIQHGDD